MLKCQYLPFGDHVAADIRRVGGPLTDDTMLEAGWSRPDKFYFTKAAHVSALEKYDAIRGDELAALAAD